MAAYPDASAVEKEHLKAIFMYLLEAGAVCPYNMENQLQPDLLQEQLSVWAELTTSLPRSVADLMCDYIWSDSEPQTRLKKAPDRIFELFPQAVFPDGTGKNAKVLPPDVTKNKEQESGLRPIGWVLVAAAAYGLYHYLTSTSAQNNKIEQTAGYGTLFKGMK